MEAKILSVIQSGDEYVFRVSFGTEKEPEVIEYRISVEPVREAEAVWGEIKGEVENELNRRAMKLTTIAKLEDMVRVKSDIMVSVEVKK
jgi:hypothetical protein